MFFSFFAITFDRSILSQQYNDIVKLRVKLRSVDTQFDLLQEKKIYLILGL